MRTAIVATLAFAALQAGCSDHPSEYGTGSAEEPLHVTYKDLKGAVLDGQFVPGPIPQGSAGPEVQTITSLNPLMIAGTIGKHVTGDVGPGSFSVAVRFDDIGTGYWIVPVGPPDPQVPGALTYDFLYDVARSAPPGRHRMLLSAANGDGTFGPLNEFPVLIKGPRPDGHVVVSLTWDTNADLDLVVVTPSGKRVDPKHVNTAAVDPDAGAVPSDTGQLDRDSNAACMRDEYREEDLVWPAGNPDAGVPPVQPEPGEYTVNVDEFESCGAPATDFVLGIWVDGQQAYSQAGRLLDVQADEGGPGLFVTNFHF
jgi:hypothetical protein